RNLSDSLSHQISREHGIWQFTKGSVRVLWFYDAGHCVICAHVFFKTTQRTPKLEIDRAVKLKREYMRCKEDGDIEIELIGED
ncbi:MAG TPA: hypothetical protein ENG84_04645, partial [Gammaproteobacteria bacterium]|nr:hypothetical protein [Gammaproteobacteria bacterium]